MKSKLAFETNKFEGTRIPEFTRQQYISFSHMLWKRGLKLQKLNRQWDHRNESTEDDSKQKTQRPCVG